MFDIGGGELLFILIAVLVLFGPRKLPELAQSLGRGIREFKKAQREFTDHINSAMGDEPKRAPRRQGSSWSAERTRISSEPRDANPQIAAGAAAAPAVATPPEAEVGSAATAPSKGESPAAPPEEETFPRIAPPREGEAVPRGGGTIAPEPPADPLPPSTGARERDNREI